MELLNLNFITGLCSQLAFAICLLPQLLQVLRSRSVENLTPSTYWLYLFAEVTAIVYFYTLPLIPWFALLQVIFSTLVVSVMLTLIYILKTPLNPGIKPRS